MPKTPTTEWEAIWADVPDIPDVYRPIFEKHLPAMLEMFLDKAKDYGDMFKVLGSKGQFADINSKYWKLKHAVWDDKLLVGEPVEEIIDDMIVHLLLLKLCREEGI